LKNTRQETSSCRVSICESGKPNLAVAIGPGRCDSLAAGRLARFTPFEFAGFLVALLELEALEEAVVLYFFLEDTHGLFKVVVDYPDFNFLQNSRPLCSAALDFPETDTGLRRLMEKISLQSSIHILHTGQMQD
jgi:hypothetical protein